MTTYNIPVEGKRVKSHQVTALHLFLMFLSIAVNAILILIGYASNVGVDQKLISASQNMSTVINYVLLGTTLILTIIILAKNKTITKLGSLNYALRIIELIIFSYFLYWASSNDITILSVLFAICIIAILFSIFIESPNKQLQLVQINSSGITIPTNLSSKLIPWHEVEGLRLRHGVLSIDLVQNSSMMQWFVRKHQHSSESVEEFAKKNIENNISKRVEDW